MIISLRKTFLFPSMLIVAIAMLTTSGYASSKQQKATDIEQATPFNDGAQAMAANLVEVNSPGITASKIDAVMLNPGKRQVVGNNALTQPGNVAAMTIQLGSSLPLNSLTVSTSSSTTRFDFLAEAAETARSGTHETTATVANNAFKLAHDALSKAGPEVQTARSGPNANTFTTNPAANDAHVHR